MFPEKVGRSSLFHRSLKLLLVTILLASVPSIGEAASWIGQPPTELQRDSNIAAATWTTEWCDSEFGDPTTGVTDWEEETLVNLGTGTTSSHSVDPTGNPGSSRRTVNTIGTGNPSVVITAHLYGPATYNPTLNSITSIDYAFDIIRHGGSAGDGLDSPGFAVLLKQDGNYYRGPWHNVGFGTVWSHQAETMVQSDFGMILPDGTTHPTEKPDFSCSGGIIEFGYATGNSRNPSGPTSPAYDVIGGIDNWCIAITDVPCVGRDGFEILLPVVLNMHLPNVDTEAIRLRSRVLRPERIDPELTIQAERALADGFETVHAIMQLRGRPSAETWAAWEAAGVRYAAYLHDFNWVVAIDLTREVDPGLRIEEVRTKTGSRSLSAILAEDRVSASLLSGEYPDESIDPATGRLMVGVLFFDSAEPGDIFDLVSRLDPAADLTEDNSTFVEMAIDPEALDELAAFDMVQVIDAIPFESIPLMDMARAAVRADVVHQIVGGMPPTYLGLSGRSKISGQAVRLSNQEGLSPEHDDFWDHDSGGVRTTKRWVDDACKTQGIYPLHGAMTAGIMLGNGFQSPSPPGPFSRRGIAPEALFDCPKNAPDASNVSYTMSQGYGGTAQYIDSQVAGLDTISNYRPIVYAVGNAGIKPWPKSWVGIGYYSLTAPPKNPIVVANVAASSLKWMQSSIGPTWDGRIKPDLAAPGTENNQFPDDMAVVNLDLTRVAILNSGTPQVDWGFECTFPNCQDGWGLDALWGAAEIGAISHVQLGGGAISGDGYGMRVPLKPVANWPSPWYVGTLEGNTSALNHMGVAGDTVQIRYRLDNVPDWRVDDGEPLEASIRWKTLAGGEHSMPLTLHADDEMHVTSIAVDSSSDWVGNEIVGLQVRVSNLLNRMLSTNLVTSCPTPPCGSVQGSGGSSAAAPVVTGALALLMEQMMDEFGATLGDHSPSPFWEPGPGVGIALPSTFKALLAHTAQDLASIPHLNEPNNPDTGEQTVYHNGPDLVTGYGIIDIAEAVRLLAAQATSSVRYVREQEIGNADVQDLTFVVTPAQANTPMKVTLAWDDAPGTGLSQHGICKLVNNLDLQLEGPLGTVHKPYSIPSPYVYPIGQEPWSVEPEPITANDIKPARNDLINTCDNMEQVMVEFPQPGTWTAVISATINTPKLQKYSIILGSPVMPADGLTGGKVVFLSNRTGNTEAYVSYPGTNPLAAPPPTAITAASPHPIRSPVWSPDGNFVAYVTREPFSFTGVDEDVIKVVAAGSWTTVFSYPAPHLGLPAQALQYLTWSNAGDRICYAHYKEWSDRGLSCIELETAYDFMLWTARELIGLAEDLDPSESAFSADDYYLYFSADSDVHPAGGLWRMPALTISPAAIPMDDTPIPVYGNAAPITRAYSPSVSPDGETLTFNSEAYLDGLPGYFNEELVQVGLKTGVLQQLTSEPANVYGSFARNGSGEQVLQAGAPGNDTRIMLRHHGARFQLNTASVAGTDDGAPDWWK